MRHLKKKTKLSRKKSHREAMLRNLARSLFIHGSIKTTPPRAKLASALVERMVARLKKDEQAGRRFLFKNFQNQDFVNRVTEAAVSRFKDNPGGITRIRKVKKRKGDDAIIVALEFSDDKGGLIKEEK